MSQQSNASSAPLDLAIRDSLATPEQSFSVEWRQLEVAGKGKFAICVNRAADDGITQSILAKAYQFPGAYSLLLEIASPGQRVLDLGAHVGTCSLYAASLGYDVTAVEAAPRNSELLKLSVIKNGLANLTVVAAAVSDHVGVLEFVDNGPSGMAVDYLPGFSTVSVPALTVDGLLNDLNWDGVRFVKMDIEGSEVAAIRGMARLLTRDDAPTLLFEANGHTLQFFQETPEHLIEAVEAFGYQCYLVEGKQLIPTRSGALQPAVMMDYLAVKQPLMTLPHWHVAPPMSTEERISRILASCEDPNPNAQLYIARALARADGEFLADQRIIAALNRLSEQFTGETQWWRGKDIQSLSREQLLALLDTKNAEIARLSGLVAGYERGRFIRLMRRLKHWQAKLGIG